MASAEQVVGAAWLGELGLMRSESRIALIGAAAARQVATDRVRRAQSGSDLRGLARAQRLLELARAEEDGCELEAIDLDQFVDEEWEMAASAAEERARDALADRIRLAAALDALQRMPGTAD